MQSRALSFFIRLGYRKSLTYRICTDHSLATAKFFRFPGESLLISQRGLRNSARQIRNSLVEENTQETEQYTGEIKEKREEIEEDFNAISLPNSPSEIKQIDSSEKSIGGLLEIIHKKKDNLNEYNIIKFLGQTSSLYKKDKSESALGEIKDSKEFLILLKTFQNCMKALHPDELVEALWYLKTLEVSRNSVIVHQILKLLKEDFNNLNFHKAVFLYRYVFGMSDNEDAVAIKAALQVAFPIIFNKTFDRDDSVEVRDALDFAARGILPVGCIEHVLNATYRLCNEIGNEFSASVVHDLLVVLKKSNTKCSFYLELQIRTFKILRKVWQDVPTHDLRFVFKMYASLVSLNRIKYDSVFVEKIVNALSRSISNPVYKFAILRSLNFMRHVQYDFLDELTDLLLDNPKLIDEEFQYSEALITTLSRAGYNNLRKEKWEKLKPIIENLPYLNNESKWSMKDTLLTCELVTLGICPHNFFNYLSEKYDNDKLFDHPTQRIVALLALNQEIARWHPEYPKPLISYERVTAFIENQMLAPRKVSALLNGIKSELEKAIGVPDCILQNRHTNQGYTIHGTMALDEDNKPISFQKLVVPKNFLVEEIKSSLNCKKMVLILFISDDFCIRNTSKIQELYSLILKTLNDSGHITIPILERQWKELGEAERGTYFWKCIRDKIENKT